MTAFAKNESLYRRTWTKYKSSKLFWRILEDNKQNKRENRGKKTVRIFAFNFPILQCLAQILFKRSEFRPAELLALKALLILIAYISEFMFACF